MVENCKKFEENMVDSCEYLCYIIKYKFSF